MGGKLPGRMYRNITQRAYTRREYIGGVPQPRITQFELGNKTGDFPAVFHLVADERCQIRHTALEAARISANRVLAKKCGSLGYHIKVRPYPHHILRQHKQAAGAGADRISSGMRAAFGRPVGTAARVENGQLLITIRTAWGFMDVAKDALRRASMKLPTPCTIVVEGAVPKNIEELRRTVKAIGAIPEEEKKKEEPAEGEAAAEGAAEGAPAEGKEGGKPGAPGKGGALGKGGGPGKAGAPAKAAPSAKGGAPGKPEEKGKGGGKPEGKGGDKGKK